MKTRDVYLINGQTLKDSDTVTVDITKGLKIQYLIVKYSNTNGATSNTVGRLASMVSKLAVIDGSNVLHSLSMDEEQAKNFYDYKALPYQSLTQAAGGVITEECIIDFRRRPGDANFYLDTSRYTNPQLQFTHAFTISASAGFATGDGKLTVIARVIDSGAAANQGFVMAKELDSFASAASGDHTTDLPLDFPIASVMVLAPVDGEGPEDYLSNFKLTADTDSFIPIDMSFQDLLDRNYDEFGLGDQYMALLAGTSATFDGDLYDNVIAHVADSSIAGSYVTAPDGNEVAAANASSATIGIHVRGSAPKASVIYRFGDGYDPTDIFSPQGVGKFQLKLTNKATGVTPKVVTVQQHP
jgi:hypothetical protein